MNGVSGNIIQAVRGPILLITLGVLVAIDHAGWQGLTFGRTWPLLIIMYGVLKLAERLVIPRINYVGPQAPPPPPPPGGYAS